MQKEELAGKYIIEKWRRRLEETGDVQHVAAQMRKQGYSLEMTLLILLGKETHEVEPVRT
jgi:hypothetical protein